MTADEQEALSTRYAPDVVRLRRLKSGRFAVYNSGGELCGIIDSIHSYDYIERKYNLWWPPPCFHEARPFSVKPVDLADLGLL